MTKKYFIIFFLLFSFSNIYAQFDIGVYGGFNRGSFKGDLVKDADFSKIIHPDFGVIFDLKLSKQIVLSFQPGLAKRGTKISYWVDYQLEQVDSINIKIDYLAIPLLLKISSKNEHFYAIGGLEAGIPLSANAMYIGYPDEKEDLMEVMSKVNIVMHFGFGYQIQIGKPTLFFEARYLQGLNNAVPIEKPEINFFPRVRTSDVQLLFGLKFPLF